MAISKIIGSGLGTINSPVEFTSADNLAQLTLSSTDADASNGPLLDFYRNSASPADSDALGVITFRGKNDANQDVTYATISSIISDASDGAEGGTLRLKVATHDGELQTGLGLFDGDAEDEIDVFLGRGTGSVTTTVGALTVSVGDATLTNGNLVVASGHGINFAATGNGSGSSQNELLDDYEEGTWTATGNNITLADQDCSYVKVGNMVHIGAKVVFPTTSDTNNAAIAGLPFASINSQGGRAGISIGFHTAGSAYDGLQFLVSTDAANGQFYLGSTLITNANLSAKTVFFGGTYLSDN